MATANEIEIRVTVDDKTKGPFQKIEKKLVADAKKAGDQAGQQAGTSFAAGVGKQAGSGKVSATFQKAGSKAGKSFAVGFSKDWFSDKAENPFGQFSKAAEFQAAAAAARAKLAFQKEFSGGGSDPRFGLTGKNGILSGLFDGIENAGKAAFGGLSSMFTDLGGGLTKIAGPLLQVTGLLGALGAVGSVAVVAIGAIAAAVGGTLVVALGAGVAALGFFSVKAREAFTKLGDYLQNTLAQMSNDSGLTAALEKMAAQFKTTFDQLKPVITGAMKTVQPFLAQLTNGISALANNMIPRLGTALGSMAPVFEGFATLLGSIGTGIGRMFLELAQHAEGFKATFAGLGAVFEQVLPALGQFMGVLADQMGPVLQTLAPVLAQFVQNLGPLLASAIEQVAPMMPALFDGFMQLLNALVPLIPPLTQLAIAILPPLAAAIQFVGDLITNVFVPAFNAIMPVVDGVIAVFSGFFQFVKAGFQILTGDVQGALNTIAGIFGTTWANVQGVAEGAMAALGGTISAGIQTVLQFFRDLPGNILSALGNVGSFLYNAGSALMQGLWDGARAMYDRVYRWVFDSLNALRNLFPFSPAKEGPFSGRGYTSHSGVALMKDFGKGIKKGARLAISAAQDAAGAAQGVLNFSVMGKGRHGKTLASGSITGLPGAYAGQGAPSASMLRDSYKQRNSAAFAALKNGTANVHVTGDADGAIATMIAKLIRTGKLRVAV